MTPGTPLTDFLIRLATDLNLLQTFNASVASARQLMTEAGLSDAQQQAVLSKNVSVIHYQLQQEGTHGEFVVPAGPVLEDRGRFTVGPQGVMAFEPPVLPSPDPPVMSGGRSGGGRPTEPPPVLPGSRGKPRRPVRKPKAKKPAAKTVKRSKKQKASKGKAKASKAKPRRR